MDLLVWFQSWYNQQCDGDWEHTKGIKIDTLDNPGWRVDICLEDTELEHKEFTLIEDFRTEDDWVVCRVEKNKYKGRGGPFNLEEILEIFHDWTLS